MRFSLRCRRDQTEKYSGKVYTSHTVEDAMVNYKKPLRTGTHFCQQCQMLLHPWHCLLPRDSPHPIPVLVSFGDNSKGLSQLQISAEAFDIAASQFSFSPYPIQHPLLSIRSLPLQISITVGFLGNPT